MTYITNVFSANFKCLQWCKIRCAWKQYVPQVYFKPEPTGVVFPKEKAMLLEILSHYAIGLAQCVL